MVEFIFPLKDPNESKVFYGSDSAGSHEHALAKDAFNFLNRPFVLLRGATGDAAVPDHSKIHKSIESLTKKNQKIRRILAWRKAKADLPRKKFLMWRVPGYKKE